MAIRGQDKMAIDPVKKAQIKAQSGAKVKALIFDKASQLF